MTTPHDASSALSPKDLSTQLARLKELTVGAARSGILSSPLAEVRRPRGIRAVHLEALWWLRAEGLLSVNELTRRVGTTVSKTTRLVDRLEEQALVWRDRSEDDRRVVRVHLTDRGRVLAEQADEAVQKRLGSLLQPLNPNERDLLLHLLGRMVESQRLRAPRAPRRAASTDG